MNKAIPLRQYCLVDEIDETEESGILLFYSVPVKRNRKKDVPVVDEAKEPVSGLLRRGPAASMLSEAAQENPGYDK